MSRAPYSGHLSIRKATLLEGTGPHPALLVDEILREVFTHLRPSATEPRNTLEHKSAFDCRRGLSSAAQACRAFYGPAIAALWSVLPGLKVAWALFPSFTLVGDDDTEEYSVDSDEDLEDNVFGFSRDQDTEVNSKFYYQTFERDIRQEEWDRFCHYAKHCEDPDGFARIHGFHALRTLTLTEVDSTGILSPFTSPNIHTLNFSLRYWDSATLELLFHDAITRFPALRSMAVGLSKFGFGPGDQERHMHANIPDFHTLFGMLPLAPALEEFSIRTPMMLSTVVGGDRELARFAETWPRLRALRFVTTLQGDVSPATLIAFARHCPQLHTLHLRGPVIRDTMAEWFPEPPLLEGGHGLRELGVCRPPPLDDPGAVASFLRVVFPNVRLATPVCCEVVRAQALTNILPLAFQEHRFGESIVSVPPHGGDFDLSQVSDGGIWVFRFDWDHSRRRFRVPGRNQWGFIHYEVAERLPEHDFVSGRPYASFRPTRDGKPDSDQKAAPPKTTESTSGENSQAKRKAQRSSTTQAAQSASTTKRPGVRKEPPPASNPQRPPAESPSSATTNASSPGPPVDVTKPPQHPSSASPGSPPAESSKSRTSPKQPREEREWIRFVGTVYDLRGFLRCMADEGRTLPDGEAVERLERILNMRDPVTSETLICDLMAQDAELPLLGWRRTRTTDERKERFYREYGSLDPGPDGDFWTPTVFPARVPRGASSVQEPDSDSECYFLPMF
ncbi:hypothetical protein VTO73DRAFT_2323 [Trametes versicolor]